MIAAHFNPFDFYFLPCLRLVKGSCDCGDIHWELSLAFLCVALTYTTGVCEE